MAWTFGNRHQLWQSWEILFCIPLEVQKFFSLQKMLSTEGVDFKQNGLVKSKVVLNIKNVCCTSRHTYLVCLTCTLACMMDLFCMHSLLSNLDFEASNTNPGFILAHIKHLNGIFVGQIIIVTILQSVLYFLITNSTLT